MIEVTLDGKSYGIGSDAYNMILYRRKAKSGKREGQWLGNGATYHRDMGQLLNYLLREMSREITPEVKTLQEFMTEYRRLQRQFTELAAELQRVGRSGGDHGQNDPALVVSVSET